MVSGLGSLLFQDSGVLHRGAVSVARSWPCSVMSGGLPRSVLGPLFAGCLFGHHLVVLAFSCMPPARSSALGYTCFVLGLLPRQEWRLMCISCLRSAPVSLKLSSSCSVAFAYLIVDQCFRQFLWICCLCSHSFVRLSPFINDWVRL